MKIVIKTKHIILFFVLLCAVLSASKIFEKECKIYGKIFNESIPKVLKCGYSTGESMNFPDDALHLFGEPVNISVGDVISFDNPNKENYTILHRVIKIENKDGVIYYTTKGDNRLISDKPITIEQINYKLLETLYFDMGE